MWDELGISAGTAIIVLIAFYFVIKWAVRKAIEEAYTNITGNKTYSDIEDDKLVIEIDKKEEKKKNSKKSKK